MELWRCVGVELWRCGVAGSSFSASISFSTSISFSADMENKMDAENEMDTENGIVVCPGLPWFGLSIASQEPFSSAKGSLSKGRGHSPRQAG